MSSIYKWVFGGGTGSASQALTPEQQRALDASMGDLERDDAEAAAAAAPPPSSAPPAEVLVPPPAKSAAPPLDAPPPGYTQDANVRNPTPIHEMVGFGVVALAVVHTVLDCQLGLLMAAPWIAGRVAFECGLVSYYGTDDEKPSQAKMINQCFAIPVLGQLASYFVSNILIRAGVKKVTSTLLSGDEAGNLGGKIADIAHVAYHLLWPEHLEGEKESDAPSLTGRVVQWTMKDVLRWISSAAFGVAVVAVGAQFGLVAAIAVHAAHNIAIFLLNEAATRYGYGKYAVLHAV